MTQRELVKRLNQLNILHRIHLHRLAAENGLHMGQLPILEVIRKNGSCTQKQISDRLQVSPPSVAVSVKRMMRAGLVDKTADEQDMRCNHITLTPKGQAMASACRAAFDGLDAQMFQNFTPEEMQQLCGYLERLIENLATEELSGKTFFSLMETEAQLHHNHCHREECSDD